MTFLTDPSWRHLRLRFLSATGKHRGLYAYWHTARGQWACTLCGHGLRPYRYYASTQTAAIQDARLRSWSADGRWKVVGRIPWFEPWDGRPDAPALVPPAGAQLSLFLPPFSDHSPSTREGVPQRAQPAAPPGASGLYVPVARKVSAKNGTADHPGHPA